MKKLCCFQKDTENKDELKIVVTKTIECIPVIRYSFSESPPTTVAMDDVEVIKACAIMINFAKPKIAKGGQGSISSMGSQPITVNLSDAARTDPAHTPSPAAYRREFTFRRSILMTEKPIVNNKKI